MRFVDLVFDIPQVNIFYTSPCISRPGPMDGGIICFTRWTCRILFPCLVNLHDQPREYQRGTHGRLSRFLLLLGKWGCLSNFIDQLPWTFDTLIYIYTYYSMLFIDSWSCFGWICLVLNFQTSPTCKHGCTRWWEGIVSMFNSDTSRSDSGVMLPQWQVRSPNM